MKHNKLDIAKGFLLLLLTVALLFSSAGVYYAKGNVKTVSAKEEKTKNEGKKGEQITVAPALEAVVVSILHLNFVKDILVVPFEFSVLHYKAVHTPKRIFSSEKYFRTLFTHIISPNAP